MLKLGKPPKMAGYNNEHEINTKVRIRERWLYYICAALVLFTLVLVQSSSNVKNVAELRADPFQVSFHATDGYLLVGDYYKPLNVRQPPAAIVINHLGNNPERIEALKNNLLRHGYAVLTYDIRGTGRSKNGLAMLGDGSKSVGGALTFLDQDPDIDHSRIFLIGASVAGDFAADSTAKIKGIRAAVALSPVDPAMLGLQREFTHLNLENVLIATNQNEAAPAQEIARLGRDYRFLKIYPNYGHGGALLLHDNVEREIISFLGRYRSEPR